MGYNREERLGYISGFRWLILCSLGWAMVQRCVVKRYSRNCSEEFSKDINIKLMGFG